MSLPPDIAVQPDQVGLAEYYFRTIGECDLYIETALALDQTSPIPQLIAKRTHAREALAELQARAVRAAERATETRLQRLQRRVDRLEHSIQQQEARPRPDVQGLAALHRRLEQAEAALDEALRAEHAIPTTPEALAAAVSEIVTQWPDDLLERALRAYAERHKAELRIARDGRTARLGPDGWEPS